MRRRTLAALLFAIACGGESPVASPVEPNVQPAAVVAVSGSSEGVVGEPLSDPPRVRVTSADGALVGGIVVRFDVASGGGSASVTQRTTDADGLASVGSWTLGPVAGAQALIASVSGLTPVTFTVTARPGPAARLAFVTTPGATSASRQILSPQPVLQVRDAYGNVPNAAVTVTASLSSGGSVTGSLVVASDAMGLVAFTDLAIRGRTGTHTLGFASSGLETVMAPVALSAGPAARLLREGGNNGTATVTRALTPPPSVRVTDLDDNPVAGFSVQFSVTSGGGTINGATATTGSTGVAAVGRWTLGAAPGPNALVATAAGLEGSPLSFNAIGVVPAPVSLTPPVAAVGANASATFRAIDDLGGTPVVSWRVNGIPGGSAGVGTITSNGVYTGPSTLPLGDTVVISAVSLVDTAKRVTSLAFFMPSLTDDGYYVYFPRVMDAIAPRVMRIFVRPLHGAATVTFVPNAGGAGTAFTDVGNGVRMFEVTPQVGLSGHGVPNLQNRIGFMDQRDASGTLLRRGNLHTNVRAANVPDVTITQLAPDAQRSNYILNLRWDAPLLNAGGNSALAARAIQLLGDRFDFLDFVSNVSTNANSHYVSVRNDVSGIGLPIFNNSAAFGSSGRLRGLVQHPLDVFFDPHRVELHEIGHAWINFATDPVLTPGVPHWPLSNVANESVMGFSIGGAGGQGGTFSFGLVAVGGGVYRVEFRPPIDARYTEWDLYLMGLLPADSVPPALIYPPGLAYEDIVPGMLITPTVYTIGAYIARHGTRSPAYGSAPTVWDLATVVVTSGRLMSASEMAFFDEAASRLESTATSFSLRSFWYMSGGRGRVRSRIP